MTTPQHIVMSSIIAYQVSGSFVFSIIAGWLGGLPDLMRLFEKGDWNKTYKAAHELNLLNLLIPFWNIHILLDKPMHYKEGGWKWWVKYIEIIFWIFEAIIIYQLIT